MNILAMALILAAELGSVSFPTSTKNAVAQAEFERGVAALHSFWYDEAAAYFQRAQKLDPQFAMAYWGEAMTHTHPIWFQQDIDAARAELESRGISFAADTLDSGVCHMAHFKDPDGNALMLHHRYAPRVREA